MDILKAANAWAKAEVASSTYFIFFGIVYLLATLGFWLRGNTPLTKALIIPMLVAGGLLLVAGISFYISNKAMPKKFETEYKTKPATIIKSELARTEKTIKTYENVALKVFPAIIVIAVLLSIFISNPTVRAISIAIIAFLSVLVLLDSQALKRMKIYQDQLELEEKKLRN